MVVEPGCGGAHPQEFHVEKIDGSDVGGHGLAETRGFSGPHVVTP